MRGIHKKIYKYILDSIFPVRCISCRVFDYAVCDTCMALISLYKQQECCICRKPHQYGYTCEPCKQESMIDQLIILYEYDELLRKIIHAYKYLHFSIYRNALQQLICRKGLDGYNLLYSQIIPIPLHKKRYIERGYNQSETLGHALSVDMNYPYDKKSIIRIKYTKKQMSLTRDERLENIKECFEVKNTLPGSIILIDDIYTTGATMQACAYECKKAGASFVSGVVLARNTLEH